MNRFRSLLSVALVAAAVLPLGATTVIPPTFDELVSRAEVIFQGTVTDVQSRWEGEGKDRHIQTYVKFDVEQALKGKPGSSYTLSMLGGTVDGHTMEVTDAPKFKVGDRDFLFVENNGTQFIPLVGIMHGRFRIQRDQTTGREFIATNTGAPISDLTQIGRDPHAATAPTHAAALEPGQFTSSVRTQLTRIPQ